VLQNKKCGHGACQLSNFGETLDKSTKYIYNGIKNFKAGQEDEKQV
jgi:hypothetical protein